MALLPSGPVRGTDNSAWLRGRRLNGKCIKLRRVRGRARKEKMESRPTRTPFDPLLIRSKAPKKKHHWLEFIMPQLRRYLIDRDGKNCYHANFTAGVFAECRTTLKFSV